MTENVPFENGKTCSKHFFFFFANRLSITQSCIKSGAHTSAVCGLKPPKRSIQWHFILCEQEVLVLNIFFFFFFWPIGIKSEAHMPAVCGLKSLKRSIQWYLIPFEKGVTCSKHSFLPIGRQSPSCALKVERICPPFAN